MYDFNQQLAQIREQIQNMKPSTQPITDSTQCPFRLPCGLCSKTNSFCGMQSTEITCSSEVKTNG